MSCWHCGSILVSYTRGGWVAGWSPFTMNKYFLSLNSLNSVKTFTKNSFGGSRISLSWGSLYKWHMLSNVIYLVHEVLWVSSISDFVYGMSTLHGEGGANIRFCQIFQNNCMELKEFGRGGGRTSKFSLCRSTIGDQNNLCGGWRRKSQLCRREWCWKMWGSSQRSQKTHEPEKT